MNKEKINWGTIELWCIGVGSIIGMALANGSFKKVDVDVVDMFYKAASHMIILAG